MAQRLGADHARADISLVDHANYIRSRLLEWPLNTRVRIENQYLSTRLMAKAQSRAGLAASPCGPKEGQPA